jgi:hypothetical protein
MQVAEAVEILALEILRLVEQGVVEQEAEPEHRVQQVLLT